MFLLREREWREEKSSGQLDLNKVKSIPSEALVSMFLISCQAPGAPVKPTVPPAALLGWWKADTTLSHSCSHPPASILRRAITCVFTYKSWGPFQSQGDLPLWKIFLIFVPLFPPFSSPSALPASCYSPGCYRGFLLPVPSAPPGNTFLPAEPQESHLFTLRVQRTGRRARGLEKSTEPPSLPLSCCNASFHVSFKERSLWTAAQRGWMPSQHHPISSSPIWTVLEFNKALYPFFIYFLYYFC